MANFVTKKPPTQPTYVFEFTQDEVDMLGGIVLDLTDRARKVRMDYPIDGSMVEPTVKGFNVLQGVSAAIERASDGGLDYDYFDFWQDVEQ